jgi:threonyl-tRNA synthetase
MEVKLENTGRVDVPEDARWTNLLDKAKGIDKSNVIAVKVNGILRDLNSPIQPGADVSFVTDDSPEGLEILRHSTSHVMAEAVRDLFKGVKVTIGPAIEKGFYYDFDYAPGFHPDDLTRIEKRMQEIIDADMPFERKELSREEALKFFENEGESYKVEIIKELPPGATISVYTQGTFTDLCRGPHIPSTGKIKAFKLTSLAGAYWRGDEKNAMLQRIYGAAFPTKRELEDYLKWEEEARKRDHRRLGRELDLFSIHEEIGAGMVVYHPYGMTLRNILLDFERREHRRRGYEEVMGPILLKKDLWE